MSFATIGCASGSLAAVQRFVADYPRDAAAAVCSPDADGDLPLHACCAGGHAEVLALLAWAGLVVDVDVRDRAGNSALLRAVANSHLQTVCALLELRADTLIKNRQSQDVLDVVPQSAKKSFRTSLFAALVTRGQFTSAADKCRLRDGRPAEPQDADEPSAAGLAEQRPRAGPPPRESPRGSPAHKTACLTCAVRAARRTRPRCYCR